MEIQTVNKPTLQAILDGMSKFVLAGTRSPKIILLAQQIVQKVTSGDYASEILAVNYWVYQNIRYVPDPNDIELVKDPERLLQTGSGDCLPVGTLLLTEGHKFVPIEQVVPGTEIWGLNQWTEVENVWFKGVLPVDVAFLNNGSHFSATKDHKIYVALCKHHPVQWADGKSCTCPLSERAVERIALEKAVPGMVVLTPDRIDFGIEEMDPDRALLEGFYVSDGWMSHPTQFSISGQDGCPKEEQKRRVQAICERKGIPTNWLRKAIVVQDPEWAKRTARMGHHAPQKHALSISLQEAAARSLLEGIMADSGKNTHGEGSTFTTTSHELLLQTRVLHKMFGTTCSERYIVDHGGLGKNPIHRLGVRGSRIDGRHEKLLRIKAIERNVADVPVYDITTKDHYVYLPEADVTVSNCDDIAVLCAALLSAIGKRVAFMMVAFNHSPAPSHIFAVVQTPSGWVPVDPVANRVTAKMMKDATKKWIVPIAGGRASEGAW